MKSKKIIFDDVEEFMNYIKINKIIFINIKRIYQHFINNKNNKPILIFSNDNYSYCDDSFCIHCCYDCNICDVVEYSRFKKLKRVLNK